MKTIDEIAEELRHIDWIKAGGNAFYIVVIEEPGNGRKLLVYYIDCIGERWPCCLDHDDHGVYGVYIGHKRVALTEANFWHSLFEGAALTIDHLKRHA